MRFWPWSRAQDASAPTAQQQKQQAATKRVNRGDDSLLAALQQPERHTLVYFNSERCTLCRTLAACVSQVRWQH